MSPSVYLTHTNEHPSQVWPVDLTLEIKMTSKQATSINIASKQHQFWIEDVGFAIFIGSQHLWCRWPQPKHVRLWFGAGGPNQNTSRIQILSIKKFLFMIACQAQASARCSNPGPAHMGCTCPLVTTALITATLSYHDPSLYQIQDVFLVGTQSTQRCSAVVR